MYAVYVSPCKGTTFELTLLTKTIDSLTPTPPFIGLNRYPTRPFFRFSKIRIELKYHEFELKRVPFELALILNKKEGNFGYENNSPFEFNKVKEQLTVQISTLSGKVIRNDTFQNSSLL